MCKEAIIIEFGYDVALKLLENIPKKYDAVSGEFQFLVSVCSHSSDTYVSKQYTVTDPNDDAN